MFPDSFTAIFTYVWLQSVLFAEACYHALILKSDNPKFKNVQRIVTYQAVCSALVLEDLFSKNPIEGHSNFHATTEGQTPKSLVCYTSNLSLILFSIYRHFQNLRYPWVLSFYNHCVSYKLKFKTSTNYSYSYCIIYSIPHGVGVPNSLKFPVLYCSK